MLFAAKSLCLILLDCASIWYVYDDGVTLNIFEANDPLSQTKCGNVGGLLGYQAHCRRTFFFAQNIYHNSCCLCDSINAYKMHVHENMCLHAYDMLRLAGCCFLSCHC